MRLGFALEWRVPHWIVTRCTDCKGDAGSILASDDFENREVDQGGGLARGKASRASETEIVPERSLAAH